MQQSNSPTPISRTRTALMTVGLVAALAPTDHLSAIAETPWELDLLRLLILTSVSLMVVWPWAFRQERQIARRLYTWIGLGGAAAANYLITGASLSLFVAFSLAVGASLDMWMTRAHIASEQMRERLIGDRRRNKG